MDTVLTKTHTIPVSLCDHNGKLHPQGALSLFMDMASEHGNKIGLGAEPLWEKGLIWLVIRTKILFHDLPDLLDEVEITTWPEKPGRIRCNRYYTMMRDGKVLAEGKNEWTMLEVASGRIAKIEAAYPPELTHPEIIACDSSFTRMADNFSDLNEWANYTVRSSDLDTSHHMNNVRSVFAVMGAFSSGELDSIRIREMEIQYKAQCFEGEKLSLRRRDEDHTIEIGLLKEDNTTAVIVRIVYEQK